MTVKEFGEKKVQELVSKGYRNVAVKRVSECKVGKGSISFLLFNPTVIPAEAEVTESWDKSIERKAAMVDISFIKPRCRKVTSNSFYAALV